MSLYDHISRHFDGFKLHISKLLCDLIEIERSRSEDFLRIHKENRALHDELKEFRRESDASQKSIAKQIHEDKKRLSDIALLVAEIHTAVVPEKVSQIQLHTQSGETNMDIQVGQSSTLTFQASGASGNPTTPVAVPQWQATNTADFNLAVAADSQSAVLTVAPTAQPGAANDVTVVVDGVTSNAVSYAVVSGPGGGGTGAEPVSSVVLTGTQPA